MPARPQSAILVVTPCAFPPHSDGEVAASYADGGVRHAATGPNDPSGPDGPPPHLNGEEPLSRALGLALGLRLRRRLPGFCLSGHEPLRLVTGATAALEAAAQRLHQVDHLLVRFLRRLGRHRLA